MDAQPAKYLWVDYEISSDPARVDREAVHRWLSEVSYWAAGRSREVMDRAIDASICVGAYAPDGSQAGFARVVTDGATFAWLCDVYVDPAVRGKSVGTAMAAAVREHVRAFGVRRVLLATHDAHGVYEKLGFAPLERPDQWMALCFA